ncbi:MAG: protein kinase [Gemmatimonadales bacterium]|nr:protein kinase [Gemmatimonadales bacterium]
MTRTCPTCGTTLDADALFCSKCGTATPTEPGVPERTAPTGAFEVSRVRQALASRYRIEGVLGEGGMATVYLAEDLKHKRQVAIKVMRPELAATLGAGRFTREVEIAAKLSHPNILPVYDSGELGGILYYVMPVVEGESLPARLKREKQLPVAEALRLAREVAEALAYAHKRGFVHRDIKPANILLSDGHALVADFGIARAMEQGGEALTQTGLAIGTPHYMSPEQASGALDIDGRTDIYALGCVLYEMLTGEPPFTGPTAHAVLARSLTEAPRPIEQTRTSLPPQVSAAVMRSIQKTAADRYATGTEMAAALLAAEDNARTGSGAVPVATAARGLKPWQWAAAAVAVLAIGAVGVKAVGGGRAAANVSMAKTVAVLPFENQGTEDDAYFASGIVEELRDRLARLDSLTVTASASADQYAASTKSTQQIAKELRADQLLMGKVRWAVGAEGVRQVRVTAELVDGTTGQVTWRDTFDADMANAFEMQGQIATRVATALGAALKTEDAANLAGRPTSNAEAYDIWLRANAIQGETPGAARARATLYEQAVALDSNFLRAWGGLSMSLTTAYVNGTRDPVLGRRAKEAMERVLRIAPDSAAAHMVAAVYLIDVSRDPVASRRATERALQLDPKSIWALTSLAQDDLAEGNYRGVFDKLSRARELNPRSTGVLTNLMRAQLYLGQFEDAVATSNELLALEPTSYAQMQWIMHTRLAVGDTTGAKQIMQDLVKRVPVTELVSYFAGYQEMAYLLGPKERELLYRMRPAAFDNDRAWWGQALAMAAMQQGDIVRARAFADSSLATARAQIEENPTDPQLRILNAVMLGYVGRHEEAAREADRAIADTVGANAEIVGYALLQYARVQLAIGNQAKALDVLEKLVDRQYWVTKGHLKSDPMFKPLNGNPRFEQLKVGGIDVPKN